ncbi:MAG: RdgB/HAM1 family non-canonical purine NTP pyrophosphatase [bacterium]
MKQIVLASGNQGKLREFQAMLATSAHTQHWQIHTQAAFNVGDVEENGQSFVENAIIKARHAAQMTGLAALADDSGLAVDALQGKPGIYSARYAGESSSDAANNAKLLTALQAVPIEKRQARFHCCIALMRHADDPAPLIAAATWEGRILFTPQGTAGFGYDPLFFVPEKHCSAAELAPTEKQRMSHRAKALQQLLQLLKTSH